MKLKSCLLIVAALSLSATAMAQDKIYKKNGEVVDAQVKEVGTRTIKYKRANNTDGPDFVIGKNEVEKIRYENGTEDYYNRDPRRPMREPRIGKSGEQVKYGNNILAVNPLQIMESGESRYSNGGPAFGFGISYERILDKNGIVSFYLPAYMGFVNANNYNYNVVTAGDRTLTNIYVMPGLKFYPTGQGIVRYAVGPSVALITGQQLDYNNYYGGYNSVVNRFTFGLTINNSLNITPTPHLYLGLEMALGASYINKVNDINRGTTGIFQFGFKAGYRF